MQANGSPHLIGKRYILEALLGTGGMGAVHRASDRLTSQVVALKRVIPPDQQPTFVSTGDSHDFRMALAQEFRTLASLRHPNIISVLDYGFDNHKQPFYTMELLEQPVSILEAGQGRPLAEQVHLLVQMLQALAYLHRRGIIHRDLKPSNVLVSGDQVKVLDFGLSVGRDQTSDSIGSTAGTLAYMAPEILAGSPASEASDLYAVGMIAYELFAGHHPFNTDDFTALITAVLHTAPDIAALQLAPLLTIVLERLLVKSPDARYSDANQVIADLSYAAGEPLPQETATRESFLQAARLVGRDSELQRLSEALEQAIQGHGSAWLLAGESGVGKSRLIDELRALAMVQGALVLRGQGIREGGGPYVLWRPALRWLSLLSDLDDNQLSVLRALVPDIETLVGRPVPEPADLNPKLAQSRLIGAIENLFRQQHEPLVVILEDLHWANESLEVLAHLTDIVSDLPLFIIGSYRDDERPEIPARLPGMNLLKLERLNEAAIAELSEAMLGQNGRQPQVVELLQRETEGNVFFLVEVVRVLAEEAGQLDRIGMVTLPGQVFVGGVRQLIQRRLSRVPDAARPLLNAAAVMGRQLDVHLLRLIALEVELDRWLATCADAAVLEVHEGAWRFAHDKLRDGVLGDLPSIELRRLHARIASAMETAYSQQPDQFALLAYHYGQAGNPRREAHFAALAGDHSLLTGAYRDAITYLERAFALLTATPTTDTDEADDLKKRQVRIRRRIADARLGLGEYGVARQIYRENLAACQAANDTRGTADARRNLGDVAQALADYSEARSQYEHAFTLYQELGDQGGVADALNSLGSVAFEVGDMVEAKRLYQQSLAMSRAAGSQWGMAGASASRGSGASSTAEYAQAAQVFQASLSAYRQTGSRPALITAFRRLLEVSDKPAEFNQTHHLFREALGDLRKDGDSWGIAVVRLNMGLSFTGRGEFARAAAHLREAIRTAAAGGDIPLALDGLIAYAHLLTEQGRQAEAVELFALALNHPDSAEHTQDEAERRLYQLERQLPADLISASWERGKTRPLEDALRAIIGKGSG